MGGVVKKLEDTIAALDRATLRMQRRKTGSQALCSCQRKERKEGEKRNKETERHKEKKEEEKGYHGQIREVFSSSFAFKDVFVIVSLIIIGNF